MKGKIVDASKCQGCLNCEAACVEANLKASGLLAPARLKVCEGPDGAPAPQLCRHCEKPSCVEACPSGALRKTPEGLVEHDRKACLGCWMCVMSCPYGMARPAPDKLMSKCDACAARDSMACVEACPSGCLTLKENASKAVEYIQGGAK